MGRFLSLRLSMARSQSPRWCRGMTAWWSVPLLHEVQPGLEGRSPSRMAMHGEGCTIEGA